MKTKILSLIAIAVSLLGLVACSEDWEPKTVKTGQVALGSMGVEVNGDEVLSRAEFDLNGFLVKIYEAESATATPVAAWTYAEMPEIFTLPVGSYRVEVMSHEALPAEWERPLYKGSAAFDIKNGEITAVGNILCKFAGLRVTLKFSDKLIAASSNDVHVKVEAGESGSLDFAPTETRSAFFAIVDGSSTLAAYFEGTVKGYPEKFHKVYTDVAAGQHRIISFTLKGETLDPAIESGVLDIAEGINISAIMSEETLDGNVTGEEETQNPQNPNQEQFNDDFALQYTPASSTLNVTSPNALSSLIMTVATDNADAREAFSAINGADLLNPGSAAEELEHFGITVSESRSVAYKVDLAGLVAAAKEFAGLHTFTFTATDETGATVNTDVNVKGGASGDAITFETKLDFEGINSVDVDEAIVVIGSEAGLAHLNVKISSDNKDFLASAGEMLPLEFDLAEVSGETAENLSSIGLPVGAEVVGKQSVDFNITDLVPLLAAFPGTHVFTIAVEDMDGNSASRTLTFVAK